MSNWMIALQTVAIVGSAVAAFFLVHVTRRINRKRATVDTLLALRLDRDYIENRERFRKLISDEDNLAKFASREHVSSDSRAVILRVLNYHEFLSTAIAEDAFDEEIYKRMSFNMCVRDWDRLSGFVQELRSSEGKPTLYQEFERLACRWSEEPLSQYHRNHR